MWAFFDGAPTGNQLLSGASSQRQKAFGVMLNKGLLIPAGFVWVHLSFGMGLFRFMWITLANRVFDLTHLVLLVIVLFGSTLASTPSLIF